MLLHLQPGLQTDGYGDNTKAALITRGIAEISRLGVKMGGAAETFGGLAGIGDLIVTCASVHSRNRKAGYLMGQGRTTFQPAYDILTIQSAFAFKFITFQFDIFY